MGGVSGRRATEIVNNEDLLTLHSEQLSAAKARARSAPHLNANWMPWSVLIYLRVGDGCMQK